MDEDRIITPEEALGLQRQAREQDKLIIWAVTTGSTDYPSGCVARPQVVSAGLVHVLLYVLVDETLEGLRAKLPPGLHRLPQNPGDPEQIIETWI